VAFLVPANRSFCCTDGLWRKSARPRWCLCRLWDKQITQWRCGGVPFALPLPTTEGTYALRSKANRMGIIAGRHALSNTLDLLPANTGAVV